MLALWPVIELGRIFQIKKRVMIKEKSVARIHEEKMKSALKRIKRAEKLFEGFSETGSLADRNLSSSIQAAERI